MGKQGFLLLFTLPFEYQYLHVQLVQVNWVGYLFKENPGKQKQIENISEICFSHFGHHAIKFGQ
jgi:hypothetical protein